MTFPLIECKFARIVRTPAGVTVLARFYRVEDGGMSETEPSQQLYARTLLREVTVTLDADADKAALLVAMKTRLTAEAKTRGLTLPGSRIICRL